MTIREYLEQKIQNYNGNNRVIGVLGDGTKIELIFEMEGLGEEELMDLNTGMKFAKEEFQSFENTSHYFDLKVRTKNHQARNHYAYKDSGKNHKKEKGNLSHLIK